MRFYISCFLILISLNFSFSQDRDSITVSTDDQLGAIKVEAQVDRKQVPQNRTVTYTIKVAWSGNLDRYDIVNVESPVLKNLVIVSTASSNWVGEIDGVKQAVKTYEYTLQPQSLGMGYIDALFVEYRDNEFDEKHSLVTNRLEVEVVDPILKKDNSFWFIGGGIVAFLVLVSLGGVRFMKRKRAKEAELRAKELAMIPIEVNYLSDLKEEVELKKPNMVESFSKLSKLLRRYFSDRYRIAAMGMSTQEISQQLRQLSVSERIIEQAEEVLKSCDVAKFSGGNVGGETLTRAYTLVEDIFNRNKKEVSSESNQSNGNESDNSSNKEGRIDGN
ncbi:protein BatD [candidate division KSB1 bacterium]|nr:protein BatD [candidate division KSB1 bacterium]NIR71486.1 protein BatD [candidate division KSB1 bacterium]NIS23407.1 protein BatD [candidate division KSB1 bacterium]NIT70298.1 protein BatD [candidate division KSB1 bacterium]NIU24021.1 protein BatD [candidate division KSB1 bacterium]